MSEQINEQISALFDGELPKAELSLLLKQIAQQPDLVNKAHNIQRSHLYLQGEKPVLSLGESLSFSSGIKAAIDQEPKYFSDSSTQGLSSVEATSSNAAFSASDINLTQPAANDKWRTLFGAGVAAAVAMFAVTAWQSQSSQQVLQPDQATLQVQSVNTQANGLVVPENIQSVSLMAASPVQTAKQNLGDTDKSGSEKINDSAYTVPKFEDLNVEQTFTSSSDLRQVKYSDYLLQNQVAPRSTGTQLSQYAQQLRATHTQQIYVDPRTGLVGVIIKPIDKQ